jgi:hypothetical protein
MGNIATVSESSSQLAETLEQYPRRVREETAALFDELDEKQENLQTTLTTLDSVIGSLDEAASSVTATAQAWESVVKAAGQFVKEVSPPKPVGEVVVGKEPGRPFDINDYQATAEALTATAGELRMLTKELHDLGESGTLKEAVGTATASVGELADRIAWRLGMLVMLIFVLAFGLVIMGRVVVPRRA